jgi:16S rRNA (guanine527-N7)-methyltransferase
VIDEWLAALVATPGLTALADLDAARRALVDDSLRGVELVRAYGGPLVDVGSGGGAPGIPLAHALPEIEVTLLEANGRKVDFLRRWEVDLPNLRVMQGRAESQATHCYKVAVAKALAPPPVAAEWCLPLVATGGAAILWVGPSADAAHVASVARQLGGALVDSPPGFFVLEKVAETPAGFPRRPGVARKRPL